LLLVSVDEGISDTPIPTGGIGGNLATPTTSQRPEASAAAAGIQPTSEGNYLSSQTADLALFWSRSGCFVLAHSALRGRLWRVTA